MHIASVPGVGKNLNKRTEERHAKITLNKRPEFSISGFPGTAAPNDGLDLNPCCKYQPLSALVSQHIVQLLTSRYSGNRVIAPRDPAIALLSNDPYYTSTNPAPFQYKYKEDYVVPGNGG